MFFPHNDDIRLETLEPLRFIMGNFKADFFSQDISEIVGFPDKYFLRDGHLLCDRLNDERLGFTIIS